MTNSADQDHLASDYTVFKGRAVVQAVAMDLLRAYPGSAGLWLIVFCNINAVYYAYAFILAYNFTVTVYTNHSNQTET